MIFMYMTFTYNNLCLLHTVYFIYNIKHHPKKVLKCKYETGVELWSIFKSVLLSMVSKVLINTHTTFIIGKININILIYECLLMMKSWLKQIEQGYFENKIFQIWFLKPELSITIIMFLNMTNLETVRVVETYNWDKKRSFRHYL